MMNKSTALFATLIALTAAGQTIQQPVGQVRLFSPGDVVCSDECWTNPNCNGARLRLTWADYEPTEGVYLWNTAAPGDCSTNCSSPSNDLDCFIQRAKATGKFLGVSITMGANSPHWIYAPPTGNAGAYRFDLDPSDGNVNGDNFQPVIWDTIYQAKAQNFMNALAAHMAAMGGLPGGSYVVTTGVSKGIDMRTYIQNFDQSIVVTDAAVTTSGLYCQVVSSQANFTTRSNPNNTQPFNGIPGVVSDDGGARLKNSSIVCQNADNTKPGYDAGCPGNPTNTTVYLNKTPFSNGTTTATINTWLIGLGEFYQMDQIAKSPPVGYAGLAGTANANGMTGSSATCLPNAADGNYIIGARTIIAYWFAAFPNTNVILTESPPYDTAQGVTDKNNLDCYLSNTYGNFFGPMVVSRQATCWPHDFSVSWSTGPKGAQAIYPTQHANIYKDDTCDLFAPTILQDLMGSFFDHNDKYWEIYNNDVACTDPATDDPVNCTDPVTGAHNLSAMAASEIAQVHFANLQPQQRSRIALRVVSP